MKKIFILTLSSLFFLHTNAQSDYSKLDEKYGYKDWKFESPETDFLKNVKPVKLPSQEVGITSYKITDEKFLKVGDCALDKVTANFFKGKLLSFYIETKGEVNSICILEAFNTSYGKGFQSNEYIEKYGWLGQKVFAQYEENSITHDATVVIMSNSLLDEYTEFNKTRAKSNATGL